MSRIFTLTKKAIEEGMNWDEAIYEGEIETVKEFETLEETLKEYENGDYPEELYGCE